MVQIPTDREVGMKILQIFGEFSVRPGEMLNRGSITSKIESHGCRIEDIQRGLRWLLDNGHIEVRNDRTDNPFLTESGFSLI